MDRLNNTITNVEFFDGGDARKFDVATPSATVTVECGCRLGKGAFGEVYAARLVDADAPASATDEQKTFPLATDPAQNAGGEGALAYRTPITGVSNRAIQWRHKVTMREPPTITTYNTGAANANWHNATDVGDSGVPVIEGISNESHTVIRNPQVSTDGVGELIQIHATADGEI